MAIRKVTAKVLLSRVAPQPDSWFGLSYSMNLYRGCQHQCIYCDSRSECYGIENFKDVLVKANAIELLRKELAGKRVRGTIGTGSMNDPYMPLEEEFDLTGQALRVIAEFRFPVHIITKSDLVLRDLGILCEMARVYSAVSFSLTTANDELARKLEPGAPPPSARFRAMKALALHGIRTGVIMMPILPFIEDSEENIAEIVHNACACGARYIIPSFGVTLRDRQRAYYYNELDRLFPGTRRDYERRFGHRYHCAANNPRELEESFRALCSKYEMPTRMGVYEPDAAGQLSLF